MTLWKFLFAVTFLYSYTISAIYAIKIIRWFRLGLQWNAKYFLLRKDNLINLQKNVPLIEE